MRFEMSRIDLVALKQSSPKLHEAVMEACIDDDFTEVITEDDLKVFREATARGIFNVGDFANSKEIVDFVSANYEPDDIFADHEIASSVDINYMDSSDMRDHCKANYYVYDIFDEDIIKEYAREYLGMV